MKKILYISTLVLTSMLVFNCSEDDSIDPNADFSSIAVWTSGGDDGDPFSKVINIDDYITFEDLSRGVVSHKWVVPSGTRLLNSEFSEFDVDYTPYIIGSGPVEYEDDRAHVLFLESGIKEIGLVNFYKDSVSGAVKEGDLWSINDTYTVDVFAHPVPEVEIFIEDAQIYKLSADNTFTIEDKASWPTIDIEAGTTLTYKDTTTIGRPSTRSWNFIGTSREDKNFSNKILNVTYNKLGVFNTTISSMRSGAGVPADSVFKTIPLNLNIIKSTKPFVPSISPRVNNDGDVIFFSVTGEVETIGSGEQNNFIVHVVNTVAGFDQNIPVSSIQTNANDPSILELRLSEPIFNTDDVTISYTGSSVISVDSRELQNFDNLVLTKNFDKTLVSPDYAGFEDGAGAITRGFAANYWIGATNRPGPFFERDETFPGPGTGNKASMKYSSPDGVTTMRLQTSQFASPDGYVAGTYRVFYDIFLANGNTMATFKSELRKPLPVDATIDWDLTGLARGEWITIYQDVELSSFFASNKRLDIVIDAADNPGATTGEQTMYFDNMRFVKHDPRE